MNNINTNKGQTGFTMVELMVVVAVIGILVAIAVPQYVSSAELAKMRTDMANVRILNGATLQFAVANNKTGADIFDGFNTDTERMAELVVSGFIADIPEPQQSGSSFAWNIGQQRWQNDLYVLSEPVNNASSFLFSALNPNDYRKTGTWSVNEKGFYSNHGLLFIENNREEYTITTRATLDEGTDGGYGILFESILKEGNLDSGYILQFDRGYGSGEVIVRIRNEGRENSPILRSTHEIIPTSKRDTWWSEEHEIKVDVRNAQGVEGKKSVNVWIDGVQLVTGLLIDNLVAPENNFTGLRSWHVGTTYHEMIIE